MVEVQFIDKPDVKLVAFTKEPSKLSVATARTCYSKRVIFPEEVTEDQKVRLSEMLYNAGHHTPFQHATFVFAISNVSRHCIWSFLHSHPYYNSEQTSQRYVFHKKPKAFMPSLLSNDEKELYKKAVKIAFKAYFELTEMLKESMRNVIYALAKQKGFDESKAEKELEKKAIENARYVMPLATISQLYHTVSGITLLRYKKMQNINDTPYESSLLTKEMIREVSNYDDFFVDIEKEEFDINELPEGYISNNMKDSKRKEFYENNEKINIGFDEKLNGYYAKLESFTENAEEIIFNAVKAVVGNNANVSKEEAIEMLLSPAKNKQLLQSLNTYMHSALMRSLNAVNYCFRKKMSHAGSSQEQRHRTLLQTLPLLSKRHTEKADFFVPLAISKDKEILEYYNRINEELWHYKNMLIDIGCKDEFAVYVLPNSVNIRFFENGTLLNYLHKWKLRTCFNAQYEIGINALQEVEQISKVHPLIAKHIGPPCFLRKGLVEEDPIKGPCSEPVWCGIKVWLNWPNVQRPF